MTWAMLDVSQFVDMGDAKTAPNVSTHMDVIIAHVVKLKRSVNGETGSASESMHI